MAAASVHVFLMCPPEHFTVAYIINPWMHGNLRRIDNVVARQQWRSLYDAMGPDYTLLRLDPAAPIAGIVAAAAQRGLPLAVLDVRSREALPLHGHRLVLVRPDQHVAWRGDEEPADTLHLVDLVRGAARASVAKAA